MGRLALALGLPLAWLAGVASQLHQAALDPPAVYGLAALSGAVLLVAACWTRRELALPALVLIGFGFTGWQAGTRSAERLPAHLEGVDLVVEGVVEGLPQRSVAGWRFVFAPRQAWHEGRAVQLPTRLQLSWYDSPLAAFLGPVRPLDLGEREAAAAPVRAGQRWRFVVRLKQPHGNLNPHGFDYELWLFEQGIGATGYVRTAKGREAPRLLDRQAGYHHVDALRQRVREAIAHRVDDARTAGVLAALVLGDQGSIDEADWDVFRATGVAHLMAISGLHVTMFAWVAGATVAAAWRRAPTLALWLPAPVAGRWAGVICAAGYAAFAGWGVPAQRTVWMLATVALLQQSGRSWPWPLVLTTAACVVTAFDPWALLQAGFWLSFGAVALLLAAGRDEPAPPPRPPLAAGWPALRQWAGRHLRAFARTQWIASLGLAPLGLAFFHQVSLVGLLANVLAVPLVTLAITPLALLGCLLPPLWSGGAVLLQGLSSALRALASIDGAQWFAPAAPGWALALGLAAGALAVLPVPRRLKLLAVPLALPMLLPPVSRPAAGEFELWALDVGQGGAVVVRTARHTLLYDAGPAYSTDSNAGERVLVPVLRAWGERRLDRMVISHRDSDHAGGASSVLEAYPAVEVWGSLEDEHPLLEAARHYRRCEADQSWEWDGVRFDILHPGPDDRSPPLKPNRVSCVLRVSNGRHTALLTGDIERHEEARLVATLGDGLRADWLLVPHHGSKTSSTPAFLDAVSPAVAVFQAGYRNRFGHPAAAVLARYRERGITVVASPSCGAYRWAAGQGQCERDRRRRYWHHRGEAP